MGVSVNETIIDTKTEKTTVSANCKKNLPISPFIKATGRNIATMEKVVATTAMPISEVATWDAFTGSSPASTCR
ncbi:hypothetical protein MBAV_004145 [Candidatus Magnetobacterium bavaricum]|uniref:Uncharacterized protein n=1 Tax=Candidatus Magnetobacterium bavaricum TaxID=29290 RepID=A0A0F3GNV0_9BACT|nr:hypothetical protein MBAV_004145 [Candidatus Magnetobacterium bavaricum]